MKKTINKDNAIKIKNFGATSHVRRPIGTVDKIGASRVTKKTYPQYKW